MLTITNVVTKETRDGRPRWTVTFSDGTEASTLRYALGGKAQLLWNSGVAVRPTFSYNKGYRNLDDVKAENGLLAEPPATSPLPGDPMF